LVDNIITSPPTYGMYKVLAGINNIENRLAPLNSDFSLNFDDIKSMVDENSKLIFICSPNNPSGNSLDDNVIERLLKETECIVCIDEAYIDFTDKKSWLARLDEFPNLIVCQTLSKAWGMAGIRLGICYASQYIIGILNKIKPPYNINQLTQNKALEVLGNEELFSQNLNVILSEKKLLEKAMLEFPFVKRIFPSDANFFLAEFDDPKYVFGALMAKEIIVRDRSKELHCDGCLRITIGTPVENKKLIEVLKKL
jgi:histidinol-phosphate aminotransferase